VTGEATIAVQVVGFVFRALGFITANVVFDPRDKNSGIPAGVIVGQIEMRIVSSSASWRARGRRTPLIDRIWSFTSTS
jgi:hypothetical protein